MDDVHANMIMECIQSLKNELMMIFIVTHDHRIIDYCDYIYILENHNIHLKKKITQSNDSLLENKMDIYSKKKSNWRYVFKSIQRNIKDLVVNYIPVSIIFMLFITIFLFLYRFLLMIFMNFIQGLIIKQFMYQQRIIQKNT